MRNAVKFGLACVLVAGVGIQFVPVDRANRLGAGGPEAPREVMYILRRACYDCHSTEGRWPIWAYVAPMSWKVVADVKQARRALNLSDWALMDVTRQYVTRVQIGVAVTSHRMPAWYYLTLHPDARLNDSDRATIKVWAGGPQ